MEFMIDESLEEIFSYLNQRALITASLVCRRWSEIIQNSSFLLNQLDLIILVRKNYFENQSAYPSGKYRNLTMALDENVKDLSKGLVEDLEAQKECIRNATLVNFDRINCIQTFSVLRNITKLVIQDYQHKDDELGVVDLPNIKHLELITSIPFAEVIGSQSIKILKIYGSRITQRRSVDNYYDLNAGINNLLTKCHNLKDLTLSNMKITNPNLKSEFFDFNLEALTIEDFNFGEENLIEFLVKQKNSLKKLAILNKSPKTIISTIIFSQLNLDELEIDIRIIPDTFNPQMINRTIKKLTIRWNFRLYRIYPSTLRESTIAIEKIVLTMVSACNAVEEFTIHDFTFASLLQHLNCNLKNLKVLRFQRVPNLVSPRIEFENFETLEVIEIDEIFDQHDIENCKLLVLKSPNLKTLKINYMQIFTSNFFIEIVKTLKNLREIHIGVRYLNLDMIDAMRQVKDLEHPLECVSFVFCSMDYKIGYVKNDDLMDGIKLNLHQDSNKLFPSIINQTKLGRMEREIDDKHEDLEHQKSCYVRRKHQIKRYEHDQDFDTDSSDSSVVMEMELFEGVRNQVAQGEVRIFHSK